MRNQQTQAVLAWLERDDVKPHVTTLVQAWNERELLGVDLADQLQALVSKRLAANNGMNVDTAVMVEEVDWYELAEHYAEAICGVGEEELTQRRLDAGGER